jgi:hypothetical protein
VRFPWLQVDADFLATGAADLAELLRTSGGIPADALPISEAETGWAMVRLWGWAISKAETPEALGLLADEDMQRLAERAAGWRGTPGAFLAALLRPAIGLAQREEGGAVRLAGMERYASTLRRMEADRARKSGRTPKDLHATSTGIPSELLRKTQTQTQKKEEALSAAADPQAPLLQAAKAPEEQPEDLQALWNTEAYPALPRWQGMSDTRKRRAAARLREKPLQTWREVIRRLSASPFCRGEEGGTGWRASPDWILQPDVGDKVLEGKYDRPEGATAARPATTPKGSPDDERARALREAVAQARAKKAAGGAS